MQIFLAAVLLLSSQAGGVHDQAPAEWLVDDRVMTCSLESQPDSDTLVISLGPDRGRELAIRRVADNTWYFLVVALAPHDVPQLMTADEFSKQHRVEVPAHFQTRAWATDSELESVLNAPGLYEAYVSDNLESEAGGHVCGFTYPGVRPNQAFKPTAGSSRFVNHASAASGGLT